jgi:hypothetical protein
MPKSTSATVPSGSTKKLPGWGSAWKKTELEELPQERAYGRLRDLPARDAGAVERGEVRDLQALHALQRQHLVRRVLPVDERDADAGVPGEAAPHPVGVLALAHVVELAVDRVRELGEQRAQVEVGGERGVLLRPVHEPREDVEVALDLLGDVRALDLDHDAGAIVEHGRVHLPDRGARERDELERREHLRRRPAQLVLEDREHVRDRDRRRRILEPGELGHVLRRQQVAACAEHLSELGERGAQLAERHAQSLRLRERAAVRRAPGARREAHESALLEDGAEPMTG